MSVKSKVVYYLEHDCFIPLNSVWVNTKMFLENVSMCCNPLLRAKQQEYIFFIIFFLCQQSETQMEHLQPFPGFSIHLVFAIQNVKDIDMGTKIHERSRQT